ncbi:hypothetical protein GCK72_021829 [Caenorhabditis remanei]|uniref:Uncharacterized protein n=1 Tax=Caenorhabditis remanei TaxID=31234 RepID=A0A6A5GJ52_CAERE|nr:hypothetical protein GCK72_021829 [Caenorhabditis remanei]KAF1755260.1 hypothetical protein GCK72_021829 [Caenorhabditis remanei]
MSVPSLLDLTSSQVMDFIFEGTLPPSAYQLDPVISNRLFEEYCRIYDIEITKSVMKEICSRLNVTRVDMRHCVVQRSEILILQNLNLESLMMGSLMCLEPKQITAPSTTLKIEALLKRCLNEESRKSLKHLDLSQTGNDYLDGWVENISKLLPSLISLGIAGRPLSATEFTTLCTCYPNLRNLDISNSNVKDLKGISNLSNLEVLAIGGLEVTDMKEVFELKKLRVLDLSSRECLCCLRNLLEYFLSCHKVLPDLRFIDCSGNFANPDMIANLLETHKTLQQVGLIGLDRDFPDFPDVKLLTFTTMRASIEAIHHYTTTKNYSAIVAILKKISDILVENYDGETEVTLRECFYALCRVIKEFPDGQSLHKLVTECLRIMCRDTRIYMLSVSERHDLVNTLFTICDHWPTYKQDFEQSETIHNVWRMFQNLSFLMTKNLNYRRIFETAMEYVMDEGTMIGYIEGCCLKVMGASVDQMSPSDQLSIFVNRQTCRHLLDLLNKSYKLNRHEIYRLVLGILYKMVAQCPEVFVEMGGVWILIGHLKKFNYYDSLCMLRILVTSKQQKIVQEMGKTDNVQRLVRFLQACATELDVSPNTYMIKEKTFILASILSEIIFHSKESHLKTIYWRTVTRILREVLIKLSGAPTCSIDTIFFETYYETPRGEDLMETPIEYLKRNRDERGCCLYCLLQGV